MSNNNHSDVDSNCLMIEQQDNKASRKLIYASILCFLFFLAELLGGIFANSLALISDSFHMLSDVSGFAISLASIWIASKPKTSRHSFGFHRAEIIGAVLSVLLIWVLTGILLSEAVERIKNPVEINAPIMLLTSIAGLVVNIVVLFVLGGHHHAGHSHHHPNIEELGEEIESGRNRMTNSVAGSNSASPSPTRITLVEPDVRVTEERHDNINIRAAIIHALGDALFSVGVIIASLIIYFKPEYHIVDPISTIFFSIIVLFTTLRILKDSLFVLMEASPSNIDVDRLKFELSGIAGVNDIHCFHVWLLSIGRVILVYLDSPISSFGN
eukprot:NODE_116_length_18347_cov_2.280962.p6 type:complete len:327 gc:universal NODE_116_length_18347_cov_2.280962:15428-16408(+)